MKNLFLLAFSAILFISCDNQEKRYTQQSPEIDTYKKVISDYEKQDWEAMASHYADTAKILNNVSEKNAQTLAEAIAQNKEDATYFSTWDYVDDESDYEMVVDDKGNTWVNFWGLWEGTLKANNKKYEIPTHVTARFVDGKIVKEFGYWDISKIMLDLQQMENDKPMDSLKTAGKEMETSSEKQ